MSKLAEAEARRARSKAYHHGRDAIKAALEEAQGTGDYSRVRDAIRELLLNS